MLSAPPAALDVVAHKFGGTSLADAQRLQHAAALMRHRPERLRVVVVSALKGTTDTLIALVHGAAEGTGDWPQQFEQLRQRHLDACAGLPSPERREAVRSELASAFARLRQRLDAVAVLALPAIEEVEHVQGLGEVYASLLLQAYIEEAGLACSRMDAREVLTVTRGVAGPVIDWDDSRQRLAHWRSSHADTPCIVITGFVARTPAGRATILGRNGSDFSGAIFAALFEARELHVWTDVDGILTADPRLVPEAKLLAHMSYAEAAELAYFGAKVLHPQTLAPAMAHDIPIIVRNSFNPECPGTRLTAEPLIDAPIKGLSVQRGMALLNIEGSGMVGIPGMAEQVFAGLREAGVSVVMISQGSSEHSICCVIAAEGGERARAALRAKFAEALRQQQLEDITLETGIAVLAAVGDGMAGTPGIAARVFQHLARARVNVRAIAQGASERNISIAVAENEAARGLRAVHAGFWLSAQTVSLGLIGPGNVGRALLAQLAATRERLREQTQLDLRLRGIASSRRMWRSDAGLDPQAWLDDRSDGEVLDLDALIDHLDAEHLPHRVLIDCSGSDAMAERYADWLRRGIHVITPAKHAGAGPQARYQAIAEAAAASGARFRYEATVGAGLPVIQTLRDLLDTGDELIAVEGILSGTLAWLFNRFDGSQPFSQLVREAHALGYTEPDPRDDLCGLDVARKLVILAREAGHALELSDVAVESLVPDEFMGTQHRHDLDWLTALDAPLAARHAEARARGEVLRYVARFEPGTTTSVRLMSLPPSSAFAHLQLTDNCIQFRTRRYRDNPLVVQGPGAGPEVTAGGVFADLLRIAMALGARL